MMRDRTLVSVAAAALALSACGLTEPEPWWEGTLQRDEIFVHDGIERFYHFYEPRDPSGSLPLVLLLHGGGGEIDHHIGVGGKAWPHQVWLDIADEEGLYLAVPQGLDKHWNCCRSDCGGCPESDDVGFLTSLIDDLTSAYDIDRSRVYATGESNGGLMAQRLAQEAPAHFAAVGAVIALMPEHNECDVASELPMPIMYQLGSEDRAIPYEGGAGRFEAAGSFLSKQATVQHWLELNRCEEEPRLADYEDLDRRDRSTAHREDWDCPATGTAVSVITLEGAGHNAPSIAVRVGRLWEALTGQQNHDLEGARELWAFMKGFERPQD
jgi:poly(3-hydroxybutyrate) depolymerase